MTSIMVLTGCLCFATPRLRAANSVVTGSVRVQVLSDSLVRLEAAGAEGFEDRATFHVINRDWPGADFTVATNGLRVIVKTSKYSVYVPLNARALAGISIESAEGKVLYQCDGQLNNSPWLPAPASQPAVWSFADTPRMVPPPWGITPAPAGTQLPGTSGWDLRNDAPDVYVFLPGGDYRQLRHDFLQLTGPAEMPPLFMFGAFDSRYHDYSEATALQQIDDYRARKIPLDVLVIDTGWRQGGSTGYQPNTNFFPDLARFIREAHEKKVRLMFNDHPEPVGANGLDPAEVKFRFDGLSGLLNEGMDVWWYDRNWSASLKPPMVGLAKEVWGMQLYQDTTKRVRPDRRPLILANVDGIDNGMRNRPMDVAAHRFTFQWTGDVSPSYESLAREVSSAIHAGAESFFPYMSADLGGHVADPTPEGYIRWIEYGTLSPIYRPHCCERVVGRMPWLFGAEAEDIARKFVNLRYRLLPVFYAAAHENYLTGEPLLRRLDLDFPQFTEASREDEYLLGQDLLVAPVTQDPNPNQVVPSAWLKTGQGESGLHAEFFANDHLEGSPVLARTDRLVDFDWGQQSPAANVPQEHFSTRWTGTVQVPAAVGDVVLSTVADDGARVWIDGRQVIDAWGPHDHVIAEAKSVLTAGQPHQLTIEFQQLGGGAALRLLWHPEVKNPVTVRNIWIPPGTWINSWNGETVTGPTTVTNETPLNQIPLFIRSGSILPLAPEMQYTGELPWNPVTLDVYPQAETTNSSILYEDDTVSMAYQRGEYRETTVSCSAKPSEHQVQVMIGAAHGSFTGALKKRSWVLRIHPPAGWPTASAPVEVLVNGKKVNATVRWLPRNENAMPLGDAIGAPDGDALEVKLAAAPVTQARVIDISLGTKDR